MKTSITQFEMLITFMEQHGDLNKPTDRSRGRAMSKDLYVAMSYKLWYELKELLNSDASGEPKTMEKWRKVWSDLKNNTKRKAARLHRAASGTGGGPALRAKLTDLEQRVLNIISCIAATGLQEVVEAGFMEESQALLTTTPCGSQSQAPQSQLTPDSPVIVFEDLMSPAAAPLNEGISQFCDQDLFEAGTSTQTAAASSGHTPCRPVLPIQDRASRKRKKQLANQQDRTSEAFLNSDREWRNLKIQNLQQQAQNKRDEIRMREMELQLQKQWLELGQNIIGLLTIVVNKFCK